MKTSTLDGIYFRNGDECPWVSKESCPPGTVRYFDGKLHHSQPSCRVNPHKKGMWSSDYTFDYETYWVVVK